MKQFAVWSQLLSVIYLGRMPVDGAEPGASEEGIHNTGGVYRLVPVGDVGIMRRPRTFQPPLVSERGTGARSARPGLWWSDRGRPRCLARSPPLSPMACMTHIESGTTTEGRSPVLERGAARWGYYVSRCLKGMKCLEYESISSTCAFSQRYCCRVQMRHQPMTRCCVRLIIC